MRFETLSVVGNVNYCLQLFYMLKTAANKKCSRIATKALGMIKN